MIKTQMSTLTMRNLNKTVIACSNGEVVFKGCLQDFLFLSHQVKQALRVTSFRIYTKGRK